MSTANNGGYKCLCPACGHKMRIRNSLAQTPVFKTMYAQCLNAACSASYAGSLTWDHTLSPSGLDQPRLTLPLAPSALRKQALVDNRENTNTNQMDMLDAVEATA